MKLLSVLVELICWLQIFICPVAIFGIVAIAAYNKLPGNAGMALAAASGAAGLALGVYFAERVRRRIGCSRFMSSLISRDNSDKA